jgi:hypothetical protein
MAHRLANRGFLASSDWPMLFTGVAIVTAFAMLLRFV